MATSFQLVLDDTSPVVNYFPFAETLGVADLLAGWNSYFSASGFLSEYGQLGQGTSMHVTGLDGAAFTVQWSGTGISLFGSAFRSTYDISIDGQHAVSASTQDGLLANFQDLGDGPHVLELVAHPAISVDNSSYVAFDRAVLNVTTPLTGADVFTEFIDINNSTSWHLIGDWEQVSGTIPDPAPFQGFRQSVSPGNLAEIFFQGSAVSVIGLRNTTTGRYNVTLDGNTTTFLGHSDWLETSVLFLQTGLDERTKHALIITNIDGPALGIAGLEITHVQGGAPFKPMNPPSGGGNASSSSLSSQLSVGTILALVLAGLVGLLAIGTLLLCIRVRRKRLRNRKATFLAGPVSSDMYDVMEPLSSNFDNDWNRDMEEKNTPYPSALPPRREKLSVETALPSYYLNVPSYSHLQPAENTSETADAFAGIATVAQTEQEPNEEVPRGRKVKSVRIELPAVELTPKRTGSSGNFRDSGDSFASIYDLLNPQSRTKSPPSPSDLSSRAPKRTKYGRPRSISLTPRGPRPMLSRIGIPETKNDVDTAAPLASRRSLLTSPVKKPRQSRRSSLGAYQSFSMVEEPSPVTISTMRFNGQNRESGFSRFSLDEDESEHRSPSFPAETPGGELLARLKAYREMRETTSASELQL